MKISYVRYHTIDKERWDHLIDVSPVGRVYAYSWYLDALAGKWDALIGGDYEWIMPLPYNFKYGIGYIATPPFVQQLGIFGARLPEIALYERFLAAIPSKFRYVNLSVNMHDNHTAFYGKQRTNYILDIDRPYEQIWNGYRPDARKKLRNKGQYLYMEGVDIDKVIDDYRTYNNVAGFHLKPGMFSRLKVALEEANHRGKLISAAVKTPAGEILASGLFPISHGRSYYIVGSQSEEGRRCHGTHILIDAFIQSNAFKIKVFDFEGSDIPGVAEFFKKWGSVPEYYHQVRIARFPVNIVKRD